MNMNDSAFFAVSCRNTLSVNAISHIPPVVGGSSMVFVVCKHHLNIATFEPMAHDNRSLEFSQTHVLLLARF